MINGKHALVVLWTAAIVTAASGFGTADTGSAGLGPTPIKSRTVVTDDGWTVTATKLIDTVDRYPGLDASLFSREGFVSLKGTADIGGKGHPPVQAATLSVGFQIGCQVDVTNGISPGLGWQPGAQGPINPTVIVTLRPGAITNVELANKPMAGRHASITTEQVEIKIDSCLGAVSIRSYVTIKVSTQTSDNSVAVYGDPTWL